MSYFSWIVEGQVAAMARPWPKLIAALPGEGVRGVLSLTDSVPFGLPAQELRHAHLPVRDFHPPTQDQLHEAVTFMDGVIADGGAVAVHCTAGLGRTGTVISAWLIHRGLGADEAIATVRQRRPGSVETPAQEAALHEFARRRVS